MKKNLLGLLCVTLVYFTSSKATLLIDYDLAFKYKSAKFLSDQKTYIINFSVANLGSKSVSGFNIILYLDKNLDSVINEADEIIWNDTITDTIKSKDSIQREIKWTNYKTGYQQIILFIDFKNDGKPSNNIAFLDIFQPFPFNSIMINEIMYDPLPGQSEYIEIFNTSSSNIDLYKWKIGDMKKSGGDRNEFTVARHLIIRPKSYAVLSSDTNLLKTFPYLKNEEYTWYNFNKSGISLNNDGDDVILFDFQNNLMDSVRYNPNWHNSSIKDPSGISLEKFDPYSNSSVKSSWGSCGDKLGGTPGKINSISGEKNERESSITISPNPFSPDADGFEDFTIIKYNISLKFSKIRIRIYDSNGRLVRTLTNNEYSASSGEILWDGYNDSKQKLRIGIYILLFEALNDQNGEVEIHKEAIVIAGKL